MNPDGPHILTLTGNLLAERTLAFDRWKSGKTQRATGESFQVGGKGINVTRMLVRFDAPTMALCFTGGHSGGECRDWLAERAIPHKSFDASTRTRIGVVIRTSDERETTFLGSDSPPDEEAVRNCSRFLDEQPDGQVLALCGSVPDWDGREFDPLRAALERWLKRGTLVADTYGPPLEWFASRPVSLVKINAGEFRGLGSPNSNGSSRGAIDASVLESTAKDRPVRNWIITDGPGTVWVRPENGEPAKLEPPKVEEVSATGSGDVLLACVLEAWLRRGMTLTDAVAFALPYAAANAAHPGVAEFELPAG